MNSHARTCRTSPAAPAALLARLAGMALIPAGLGLVPAAQAQVWRWNTSSSGLWGTSSNWQLGSVPAAGASVFLGDTAAAENSLVFLDVSPVIANLTITDGMSLITNLEALNVTGSTLLSGANNVGGLSRSRLIIDGTDGTAYETGSLTIQNNALVQLRTAVARVNQTLNNASGSVEGVGTAMLFGAGTTFVNDGTIRPGTGLGLAFRQIGAGRFNLDGNTGNGHLDLTRFDPVTGFGAALELEGNGLTDTFSGTITMGEDSGLRTEFSEAWTADIASTIVMQGTSGPTNAAFITNLAGFTIGGDVQVVNHGNLHILSPDLVLTSTADVHVEASSRFGTGTSITAAQTRLDGVTFHVSETGVVSFEGDTTVLGATMTNTAGVGGIMRFEHDSQWDGDVTVDGRLVFSDGHTQIIGNTTINTAGLNMGDSDSTWTVGAPLTINADTLDGQLADGLEGHMTITGGFTNSLTMNLTDPSASWRVGGRLTIGGVNAPIPITRVSGNRMRVEGNLDVTTGIARVNADAEFVAGSEVFIADAATLRMQGFTVVEENAAFSGRGWLHNATGATLRMDDGSSLERVGLRNAGDLFITIDGPGVASADRFESTADARFIVDIYGLLAGSGHDLLFTTDGPASLAGELVVLLDQSPGGFRPQVGDEFTILTALSGVSGTFANVPGSAAGGLEYGWQVLYHPNSVVLRLERIVPTPGTAAILGLAGLLACRRRR